MDRAEELRGFFRRASGLLYGGRTPYHELCLPANRSFLHSEAKRRGGRRSDGVPEYARAVLALEALEFFVDRDGGFTPRAKAFEPAAAASAAAADDEVVPAVASLPVGGSSAAPDLLQLFPVRARPPAQVTKARAEAARLATPTLPNLRPQRGPPTEAARPALLRAAVRYAYDFVAARRATLFWLTLMISPRLMVAAVVRTMKSIFEQLSLETGRFGFDVFTNTAANLVEQIADVENVLLNASAAVPPVVGASLLVTLLVAGALPWPALPP